MTAPFRFARLIGTAVSLGLIALAVLPAAAQAERPLLTIEDASSVTATSAHVSGTVDPQGQATTYRFQYATYENFSDAITGVTGSLPASTGPLPVEGELTGLTPGRTYRLRLLAKNADGSEEVRAAHTFRTTLGATGLHALTTVLPTNLHPGGAGTLRLGLVNSGAAPSTGPITVTDTLPPGLTATAAGGMPSGEAGGVFLYTPEEEEFEYGGARWVCTGNGSGERNITGATVVTCTSNPEFLPSLPAGSGNTSEFVHRLGIEVAIAPGSGSEGTFANTLTVEGGGASAPTTVSDPVTVSSSEAAFGFAGWDVWSTDANGMAETRAGSHPYAVSFAMAINEIANRNNVAEPRDLEVDLLPGFFGDPSAMPRCTRSQLDGQGCPTDTQVGTIAPELNILDTYERGLGVFNMVPRPGVPASFAFSILGLQAFIDAEVSNDHGYGLVAHIDNLPEVALSDSVVTLWGVPADPSHDFQRRGRTCGQEAEGCASGQPEKPLLTMPTSCVGPQPFTIRSAASWTNPDAHDEAGSLTRDNEGNPVGMRGCNQLDFSPTFEARPTTNAADSPTGLHVDLHFPPRGLQEPEGLTEANLKATTVTLPKGLVVNPSGANGLAGCNSQQIGLISALGAQAEFTNDSPQCPQASKIGTVSVETPILAQRNAQDEVLRNSKTGNAIPDPLPGSVYIAAQSDNPFKSLLALYVVIDDPATGVVLKLAGEVKPDPVTGQLTATFPENPELPFEDFNLDFFKGAHATLTTPPTCGPYETTTDLTPWTTPEGADATPSDSFEIAQGAGGAPCPASEAAQPNRPAFTAGTLAPRAGAYSPFLLHLARQDGSQRIKGIDTTLPPGLVGKLAGVAECSEAQLAQAQSRNGLGQGALEQSSPSCPLASEVGKVSVGAGSGPDPLFVAGHAYLAGPYKGAPLSLAVITPAVAGPFDLGTVVVRTALYVNPETAQIHAVSDPFPTILDGIPLDIRSVDLKMDRPDFTLNPTNCSAMAVLGSATSTFGNVAPLNQRFQVGECTKLGFAPKLKIDLKGATRRAKHPALTATLTYPSKGAYANIAAATVALPHSEFLDQAHIKTICTRVQFAEGDVPGEKCPAGSVYGFARAITPLLDKPLEGPVYLRSSSHPLPDLVAALNGQIQVVLDGTIDSVKGGIRNRFEVVPDAPVSKFTLTMQGGKKGLLVNSTNLCRSTNKATARFTAQNGKTYDTRPVVTNSCGKAKKKHKSHKHRGKH